MANLTGPTRAGILSLSCLKTPTISVLLPTYNYARYLPEAIESVLSQEFRDFELLIADDCSSDNTAEVVKPYVQRDPRVQFIAHARNLGMVNNWNYCLGRAGGEYVKFLFGDDRLFHPQALGKMLAMLQTHSSATLAASARVILDENSKVVNLWRYWREGCHDGRKVIKTCLRKDGENVVGEPSVVMFRKADAGRGFDPAYEQVVDVEMWFHLLEKGDLVYTREPLCAFRVHSRSKTNSNTASGVGRREHAVFYSLYAIQPWLPRNIVLPHLCGLRRQRRKHPETTTPEILECEQRLITRFGQGWQKAYFIHYLWYKITKPFLNPYYSIQKRISRWRYRQGS